jgi:D-glycero-alpha-D-manno-heptose-7-phosphate kinase
MIIVQTPLRVSFFGGGTDFPSFFREEGGAVLTTAIDKYIFVMIKKRFDHLLRIGYTETEMVETVGEIKHELIRESLRITGIDKGVEILTMGDVPAAGSGLGSSSTVTVGALHAMYSYLNESVSVDRLASEACRIEVETLGKPIGYQDQYIAAHGGLRFIEFNPDGTVTVEKVNLLPEMVEQLNENLLLFYTGKTRRADSILIEQQDNITLNLSILRQMKELAYSAHVELVKGNVDIIGELLYESWCLKKQLARDVSNDGIEELFDLACRAGAMGGKITGAGGGGFLLLYCQEDRRKAVRKALSDYQELPFRLEPSGVKVIFNYQRQ